MIEEYAVIVDVDGDVASLEIERRTACGLCGQKRGCGNATWGKLLGHDSHTFSASNAINANVGDSVVVGIEENAVLSSAFFMYVVPLFGLLLGAVLADVFLNNEFYVMLGAATGLVLTFLWVKHYLNGRDGRSKNRGDQYRAVILRHADDVVNSGNAASSGCERSKISN